MNNEISSKTFSSVAVSLAAIIPVTPIVSIAGSTLLCDITTTVTSTTTTPTPVPTSTSIEKSKSPPTAQAPADNSKATGTKHSMSDAAAKTAGAAAHATGAGAVATATNNATANTNSISNVAATTLSAKKETQAAAATEITTTAAATTTTTPSGKTHEATKAKQPEFLLYDLDDGRLKKLLDEAYSYKNPRDKENKSDIFLTLLSQVENEKEDQPYNYRASRYTRNSSSISSTSASYGQQHYPHSHHHKQGGSLQDLSFDAVHNESLLDCDYNFGVGGQRNRRHNRNSRQTKYSSVSSRQREGGSLPSNVNVTNCGSGVGIGQLGGALEQPLFMHDLSEGAIGKQQQQQRRATVAAATTATTAAAASAITADKEKEVLGESSAAIVASLSSTDYVIEMDEPMMDIEQQEHILPCKSQDAATQNMPFYDRLENYDVRIPRVSISGSIQSKIDFAPTRAQTYIDEGVRFTTLERSSASGTGSGGMAADTGSGEIIDSSGMFAVPSTVAALLGGATGKAASSIASCSASIDAKYLPLDENYKSCKSVLGEKSEMVKTPATSMFSTTKTITRQYDENGNSLNEVYQAGCQAAQAVINASSTAAVAGASAASVNSASSSTTSANAANTGQSQAKAKLKKKSQQERNTKTVDVESVAGYRGKDPVEVLVKYIESTGEDNNNSGKQGDSKSQNNKFNDSSNKKKARKQDKEKQPKMKKSNSLEELRSCAKIDVDDLKRSAATTESNVMLRNKGGGGGGKNNKNNSSSTADINKNFDSKEIATTTASTATVNSNKVVATATNAVTTNSRKGERRSWGTEELQYLGEHHQHNSHNSNNNHEEKSKDKEEKIKDKEDKIKEKDKEKEKDKDKKNNNKNKEVQKEPDNKEQKEKHSVSTEKIEKSEKHVNATECHITSSPVSVAKAGDKPPQLQQQPEKPDKQEKQDKRKKSDISLAPSVNTIISVAADVLVMDASVLTPETEEFHVVTKKKKAKKQRASVDETNSGGGANAIGFNRAHNFTTNMQKSALAGTAATLPQQQQQARYKYYNNNSNNSNNNTYAYSERVDYFGAYHGNNSNNNYPYQYQQHNQQHHAQQQQHSGNVVVDKSRRKSTSSMPPSEKSDSSDLDSVHSLPIESTTAKSSSSNNSTSNNKPRHKGNTVSAAAGSTKNAPAPISYAGIAAAAAATQTAPSAVADKWPVVDAANGNHVAVEAANSIEELMAVAAAASGAAAAQIGGASTKPKAKKLAHKPDFPELVASAAPAASASTPLDVLAAGKAHAYKPVSYSQRLVAVGAATNTSVSSNDAWINPTPAAAAPVAVTVAPVYASDVKEVPKMELLKTDLVTVVNTVANVASSSMRQQATQQPQQAAQQTLQKSKSVEHESYNYNSCNLDLQYPALEKTVKRHSATNVASSPPAATATSAAATAQFNFAAAAKQQMLANEAMAPVKAAPAAAITLATTLTTSSSNIAATAVAAAAVNSSDVIAKKSKEKSPPASDAQLATVAARKHKKDKQPMLETMDTITAAVKSSTSTQTNATSSKQRDGAPAVINNAAAAVSVAASQQPSNNNKPCKTQPSQGKGGVLALIAGAVTTAITTNRPAVIILNDDRSLGASNEFTFGDFNEDELKFFDDDLVEEDKQHKTEAEGVANEVSKEQQYVAAALQQRQEKTSPTTTSTCFNDSGASSDVVNNTTQQSDDIMLLSGSDACSPNASFAHSQSVGGGAGGGSGSGNAAGYQSNDSGVYTTTTASGSNKSTKGSSSNNQKRTSPPTSKDKEAKWNNFLKIPFPNAVSGEPEPEVAIGNGDDTTSSDNSCPLPQQLETCNEIETAIISAARAAAEYQQLHKQQPAPQQQPQQNSSNSYSNSSSFSSSSSASMDATPPALAGMYPTALASPNSKQSCQVARRVMPQNDVSDNTCTRSRSNSSGSQRGAAVVLSIQRKEFDIHFIPPPVSTALNLLQHNGIIVDFINSAWEEVAKVTKFYDGQ